MATEEPYFQLARRAVESALADPNHDIDAPLEFENRPALIVAAEQAFLDLIQSLLARGADPNVRDEDNNTPIIRLGNAYQPDGPACVRLLLDAGADPNAINDHERSALQYNAASGPREIAEMLIDAGADIETAMRSGVRPLHHAAKCGNIEVLKLLIDRGAELEPMTKAGATPLNEAQIAGHQEAIEIFQHAGAGKRGTHRLTPRPIRLDEKFYLRVLQKHGKRKRGSVGPADTAFLDWLARHEVPKPLIDLFARAFPRKEIDLQDDDFPNSLDAAKAVMKVTKDLPLTIGNGLLLIGSDGSGDMLALDFQGGGGVGWLDHEMIYGCTQPRAMFKASAPSIGVALDHLDRGLMLNGEDPL